MVEIKLPECICKRQWQIFFSACASIIFIPFGIMLGWPSPTYPTLLREDASIPITMDQTALITGFLMSGNTLATPFSSTRRLSANYAIILSASLISVGWLIMWQAQSIFWLIISRFIVGLGNGFGFGQLKNYIREIAEDDLAEFLVKQISLLTYFGVILAYGVGTLGDFRTIAFASLLIAGFVWFLSLGLPSTPRELIKSDKVDSAKRLISMLSPDLNADEEVKKVLQKIDIIPEDLGWLDFIRDKELRKNFALFGLLVFFQQFSGAPPSIVYSQIIFEESFCPLPELCAICYSIVFFLANIFGVNFAPRYNKKTMLLISSLGVSLILGGKVAVLYFQINYIFWRGTSVVLMLLFAVVHTIGLGNIPPSMISDLFPKSGAKVMGHFFIMLHSMSAVVVNKIFQVLYARFDMYVAFAFLFIISLFSVIFIIIFVPRQSQRYEEEEAEKTQCKS